MNARDDFDDLVSARLRASAPGEAPAHLMDSLIDRLAVTPQRGRGLLAWLSSPGFRFAAAAVVFVAAVVAGAQFGGLFDRPAGTDPTASPSGTPPSLAPSGSPAATDPPPTESDEPSSSPAAGDPTELVLRLYAACDVVPGQPIPRFTLMADGTVVWLATTGSGGLTQQAYRTGRLTASGLDELRARIFADGWLDASGTYRPVLRPDAGDPPGHGACEYTYTADDGAVVVRSTSWFGDAEETAYYEPAPERRALDTLANALADPESLLDADDWAGPSTAYEGTAYRLALRPVPVPPYGTTDVAEIPWPFDGAIGEFGEAIGVPEGARCGVISRDDAAAIVGALEPGPITGLDRPTYATLDWAEANGTMEVYLIPLMPDGYPTCEDLP